MRKLTDLCDIQYGYAFDSSYFTEDSSYIPIVRIRDVKRGFSKTHYSSIFPVEYVIHKGDLLVGMDGEFNIAKWQSSDALLNQRVCKLTAKEGMNKEYLRYAMIKALKDLENKTSFVTVKHLTAKELNRLELNVPSVAIQNQRENTLSALEKIMHFRSKQLKSLDDLIKARFIEMFGRPFINNLNWESKQIKNVVNEVKYGTSKPSVENGEYKYLRMNNLTYDGRFDLTDLKFISLDNDELEKCVVRKGDVLFNRTNSLDLIGKTADFDFDEDMVIAGYIIRIRLKETIVPKFFSMYMNTDEMKLHLRTIAKGAVNQANINAQELQEIPIYLPPIELQNQFVNFVRHVDKSRKEVKKSLEKTQQLYDSLMQEYFG